MRLYSFAFLADENIGPRVIAGLRERGCDVTTAKDAGLAGAADRAILAYAAAASRVVITHDPDFGRLALTAPQLPGAGLVFVRPGHINADVVLAGIDVLDRSADLPLGFVATLSIRRGGARIRIRHGVR
jgi:predicted nuclease of predicted toxin-antitoxin system